jgi:ABC-2 type transport system ATP-binding protein
VIRTAGLVKRYGKLTAVDGLDLTVDRGELFGFLGPNGAGKTTTIQILATLLPPTAGVAEVDGLNVRSAGREVRRKIGYMPDFFGVYENLTVREYLEFFSAAYDVPNGEARKIIDEVLELTDLGRKRDERVDSLSRGMQQRLGLARVLVHDPDVLLLDEPASGLDPRARIEVREILKELRTMGKTILLSSHILSEIAEICTSLAIIHGGKKVISGSVRDVLAQAGVGNVVRVRARGDLTAGATAVESMEGVERVEANGDGELRAFVDGVDTGAAEVVGTLVAGGLRVEHVESESVDLEEAYLRLTDSLGAE